MAEEQAKLSSELRMEVASVARDITYPTYAGILRHLDDTLITRGGSKGLRIYDELMRDCHAYAVIQKRRLGVLSRPWLVEPASPSRIDRKAADMVRSQLEAIDFDNVSYNLLDATLKGFAAGEVMWGRDGSEIVASEVRPRNQRRFTFAVGPDGDWQLRLLTIEDLYFGIPVPDRKFIVHSFGSIDGNPFGLGQGTRLFWPCFFKRQDITFWLAFADKFGSPTAIGKYQSGTGPEGKAALLATLRSIAQDAGVIYPEGVEISLLEAARSGTIDTYEKLARYMDEQMSEAVLGETGSTNQSGTGGSRARDQVGAECRKEILEADAGLLTATLRRTLVKWIVDFNVPGAGIPRVYRDFSDPEDLKTRSERDSNIVSWGFKPTLDYVIKTYGEGWEVAEPPPPPPAPVVMGGNMQPPATPPGDKPPEFAQGADETDTPDAYSEQLRTKAGPIIDGWISQIRELLDSSESLPEFSQGLGRLYPNLSSSQFRTIMQQAMATSRLAGRFEAHQDGKD